MVHSYPSFDHDDPVAGHFGRGRAEVPLKRNYEVTLLQFIARVITTYRSSLAFQRPGRGWSCAAVYLAMYIHCRYMKGTSSVVQRQFLQQKKSIILGSIWNVDLLHINVSMTQLIIEEPQVTNTVIIHAAEVRFLNPKTESTWAMDTDMSMRPRAKNASTHHERDVSSTGSLSTTI